jgi:flagellar hook-basal body complex protein FliE
MKDLAIQGLGNVGQSAGVGGAPSSQPKVEGNSFGDVLKESISKVDSLQKEADRAIQEMAAGSGDIHNAMIAMEKASISFQMMMQVRNKIVSAYEEVMRMQV